MKALSLLLLFFIPMQVHAQTTKTRLYSPFDFENDTTRSRQVSFTADTTLTDFNIECNSIIDSIYKIDKDYDFEFRLWKRHLEMNFDNVFILTLKNNKWTARYFDLNDSFGDRTRFTERKVDQTKSDQLWTLLVDNKVLTLATEQALTDKLVMYEVDSAHPGNESLRRISMTDGILYSFRLKTRDKQKSYHYGCPHALLKRYSNVEELYRAVVIIMLIQKFLAQPLQVC